MSGSSMDIGDVVDEDHIPMVVETPQRKQFVPRIPPLGPDSFTGSTISSSSANSGQQGTGAGLFFPSKVARGSSKQM